MKRCVKCDTDLNDFDSVCPVCGAVQKDNMPSKIAEVIEPKKPDKPQK